MVKPNGLSSVNWSNWLSGSFTSLDSRKIKSHAKAIVKFKRLQSLIEQSTYTEPVTYRHYYLVSNLRLLQKAGFDY